MTTVPASYKVAPFNNNRFDLLRHGSNPALHRVFGGSIRRFNGESFIVPRLGLPLYAQPSKPSASQVGGKLSQKFARMGLM